MTEPPPLAHPDAREPWMSRLVRAFLTGPLSPMLLVLAAVAGAIAVLATPREEEPQIVVPSADVLVSFPGASAEEVEMLVSTPLERLLWQIDGVEHVYSVSRRDGAVVTVRFFVGEDRERALVRLQSRIDAHRDEVPPGVTGWVVRPVEIDDVPIVALTLWSPTADDAALRRAAEEMTTRLEPTPDLSRTEVIGGRAREVRVELDAELLAGHGLSALEVASSLRAADASLTVGAFDRGDRRTTVVAGPFVGDLREVEGLVVGAHEGRPVRVRDVARVTDGPEEATRHVRISFGAAAAKAEGVEAGRPHPAVTIAVSRKKGTNAVAVARTVTERAREVAREVLPSDVRLRVTRDYGLTADEKVNELLVHLALAIVTVVGLVALALGWREGLIVAAAVPVTFALTLLLNLLFGFTINRVTLFALVLSLGLVCDDPIVDVENIHRHFARRRLPPLDAVIAAVNEVRPPVIVATLAVILSFLPMAFITGMMGPYMRPMAVNVPVAMAMSLLVAFTVTPWMAYRLLKPRGDAAVGQAHAERERPPGLLSRAYRTAVSFLLDHPLARLALWAGIVAALGVAGWLALSGAVPLKMLPYDNKSELQVVLDMPEGTTLEATDALVRDVERHLATVPEVTDVTSHVGVPSPIDVNGLVRRYGMRRQPHLADVRLNLVDKHDREQQSHAIAMRVRRGLQAVADRHGASIKLLEMPPGPPVLSTLVGEVHGPPQAAWADLVAGAREVARRLAAEPGVVDVDVMAESARDRLEFVLDKEKAALHGVATSDVVRTLAIALGGDSPATVHEPGERQSLRMRLVFSRTARSGEAELSRVSVKGAGGSIVPLGEIGRFTTRPEDQPVTHKDLERTVFVLGEVAGRPPAEAVFAMQRSLADDPPPGGLEVVWDGEGEWKITVDVFRDLGLAFLVALLAIYALLVVETRSFGMPGVVMLSIPLGAIGIFPGFWLLNRVAARDVDGWADPVWFTATGMIGMIALAGIVVRNAIILIDFVRQRRAAGVALREAVLESGMKRFRPILLT
ncbi:MAG TPA: efflux RND transporter permease subunit, partial [Planctomycetota bacterium]|nr:efflux RND transporter permease subunit [Planctomycetota bacterium]